MESSTLDTEDMVEEWTMKKLKKEKMTSFLLEVIGLLIQKNSFIKKLTVEKLKICGL